MRNIRLGTGKEIIDAKDIMSLSEQPFTKMRAEKTGTAGYEDFLQFSLPS